MSLVAEYQSPLHFPPAYVAITLWRVLNRECERGAAESGTGDDAFVRRLRAEVWTELHRARGMVTMRRPYYESIGGMYYLFDDFNDRPVHLNHAMQMLSLEVIETLIEWMKADRRQRHIVRARAGSVMPAAADGPPSTSPVDVPPDER